MRFGGIAGTYAEMVEFDNVADYEKMLEDERFKRIFQEFKSLLEATTYSINVWNAVE